MNDKTKTIKVAGHDVSVGPFVLGQTQIIVPVIMRFMRAPAMMEVLRRQIAGEEISALEFMVSFNLNEETITDMSAALAAALPKHPDDHPDPVKRSKRPTLDDVRAMEIDIQELLAAIFAFVDLCGFRRKKEGVATTEGESKAAQ